MHKVVVKFTSAHHGHECHCNFGFSLGGIIMQHTSSVTLKKQEVGAQV